MFCLLLLVSANVASLAIARGVGRAREIAIRLALGAGGSRVTRQLIAESAFSAIVTMVIAIVLTAWWVDAALSIAPAGIPRMHEVALNARVASFAVVLAILVTAIGNAVPTLRASRTRLRIRSKTAPPFRPAGPAGCARDWWCPKLRLRCLLVGAGPLARTFAELRRVDVGFNTSNLLVLRITPDAARYRTAAQTTDYYRRVLDVTARDARDSISGRGDVPADEHDRLDFTRPYWREQAVRKARRPGRQHSDGDAGIFRDVGSARDCRPRVHGR